MKLSLDKRPVLMAIAGPNGAGKSTFYQAHLSYAGLPFVNADVIAGEAGLGACEAAKVAENVRREHFRQGESFVFETVFSDPAGEKLAFLEEATLAGYNVILFFIGLSSAEVSADRVVQRVLEGGHNVPVDKLVSRYPRVMENLRIAVRRLPLVLVYDNDDLREPYRFCLAARNGTVLEQVEPLPQWVNDVLP